MKSTNHKIALAIAKAVFRSEGRLEKRAGHWQWVKTISFVSAVKLIENELNRKWTSR